MLWMYGWVESMNRTEKILDQLLEDMNLALIKAKAQLEYIGGEDEWNLK